MSRSESHSPEKLRADYDKIMDKVMAYSRSKEKSLDTLLKELADLELESNTMGKQHLFYILCHDTDKISEDLLFLKRLAAIKCILPELTDPRHGSLIDSDGHLRKSKIWHRESDHGSMNIFSSFWRIGHTSLERISRLIRRASPEDSESEDKDLPSNLVVDLFLNFTDTSRKAVILKDILSAQDNLGFSALHQACHDHSQNLVFVIFDAVGKFIPSKDQKDVVLSLCKKTTESGYTPLNSLCRDDDYATINVFFDAVRHAVPKKDLSKTVKKILGIYDKKNTPLLSACLGDSTRSIKALFDAVMLVDPEKDREKLTKKLLLEHKDSHGLPALTASCFFGSADSIELIFGAIAATTRPKKQEKLATLLLAKIAGAENPALTEACANKKNPANAIRAIFRGIDILNVSEEGKSKIARLALLAEPSALDRACALGDPNSITEIFNGIERFIPAEERAELVTKLLRSRNRQGFYPASNASNIDNKKSASWPEKARECVDMTLSLIQNARRFLPELYVQDVLDQKMTRTSVETSLKECSDILRDDRTYQDKLSSIYNANHIADAARGGLERREKYDADDRDKKRSSYHERGSEYEEDEIGRHAVTKRGKTKDDDASDSEDYYESGLRVTSHERMIGKRVATYKS